MKTKRLALSLGMVSALGVLSGSDRLVAQEIPVEPAPETPQELPETPTESTEPDGPRFTCQSVNGQPTVMYAPKSQPSQAYPWAVPEDMGSAWPAERRCNEISRRLEEYRPDGLLELSTSVENGYNIVCVTTEATPSCRIVFTVPPGQDPQVTRDSVFNNLVLADQGNSTEGVVTFTEDGNILEDINDVLGLPSSGNARQSTGRDINLRPFLDPADGGTGTRLAPTGRTLNPDNF